MVRILKLLKDEISIEHLINNTLYIRIASLQQGAGIFISEFLQIPPLSTSVQMTAVAVCNILADDNVRSAVRDVSSLADTLNGHLRQKRKSLTIE